MIEVRGLKGGGDNNAPKLTNFNAIKRNNKIEITYHVEDAQLQIVRHFLILNNRLTEITAKAGYDKSDFYYLSDELTEGVYTVQICVDDGIDEAFSNVVEIGIGSIVPPPPENKPPQINNLRNAGTGINNINISYDVTDESISTVKHYLTVEGLYINKDISNSVLEKNGVFSYNITNLTSNREYRIKIKCVDEKGLSVESTTLVASTLEPTNEPPKISNFRKDTVTNTSIKIAYNVADENIDTVKHYLTIDGLYIEKDISNLITRDTGGFSYNIAELAVGREYKIKIKCTDEKGASVTSETLTVSTTKPSNKPPTLTNLRVLASETTNTSLKIAYTATDESTLKHYLTVTGVYNNENITSAVEKSGSNYTYLITGLQKNTTYTVKVKVEDVEGLSKTASISATTANITTNTAPVISNFRGVGATYNSIKIRYKVIDEDINTLKHYISVFGAYIDKKDITLEVKKIAGEFEYTITDLEPYTYYDIKIDCTDDKGLSAEGKQIMVSTTSVPNNPPEISDFRSTNKSENNIEIAYNVTDESVDTLKHFITVNGLYTNKEITNSVIRNTGGFKYVINGLEGGKAYTIKVKVTDNKEASAESSPISITTIAPVINNAPVISDLTATEVTRDSITITFKAADEDVPSLRYYLTVEGLYNDKEITSSTSNIVDGFRYVITDLAAGKSYKIKVKATDNAGLSGESAQIEASTEAPPKAVIYGFKIDESNSNSSSAITYIEDSAGFTPASGIDMGDWKNKWPFNKIKPCFLRNGKVVDYMKEFNYTRMNDGTEVDDSGDVMTEFPKLYWNFKRSGNILEVRISETKVDSTYECPAFMYKGKECAHTYIGGFFASNVGGKLKSLPGKDPLKMTGRLELRSLANANGEGYEQLTPYKVTLLGILEILLYKSFDSQRMLGIGPNYNLTRYDQTGATKLSGFLVGDNSQFSNLKFLGLENIWGAGTTTIDGIEIKNKKLRINQTGHPRDETYEDVGIFSMGTYETSLAGYMSKAFGTNKGCFFPAEFKGSDSTFYADDCYIETDVDAYSCYFGGDGSGGLYKNGIFFLQQYTDPKHGGNSRLYFGRLTYTG